MESPEQPDHAEGPKDPNKARRFVGDREERHAHNEAVQPGPAPQHACSFKRSHRIDRDVPAALPVHTDTQQFQSDSKSFKDARDCKRLLKGSGKDHPFEMKGMSQFEKAFAARSTVKRMVKVRLRLSRVFLRAVPLPSGFTSLSTS